MKTFQHFYQFLLFFLFHIEFHTLKRRQTEYSQHRFRINNISSADQIHLIPEVAIISRIGFAANVVPSILLFFLIHLMFFYITHQYFLLFSRFTQNFFIIHLKIHLMFSSYNHLIEKSILEFYLKNIFDFVYFDILTSIYKDIMIGSKNETVKKRSKSYDDFTAGRKKSSAKNIR